MTILMRIYHFLGGIRFALILIATVTAFVIAGTLLESYAQSHRYAASFTYNNPLFQLLLWGFFINILFSATRRWPFQVRHIPFLITHLGLLMILAGALAKSYFGIQGNMGIMEGSGSHEIFETDSYAVQIERKGSPPQQFPLRSTLLGGFASQIVKGDQGLHVALADYTPHSIERFYSWIKAGQASFAGLPRLPVSPVKNSQDIEALPSYTVHLQDDQKPWHLYALNTPDLTSSVSTLLGKHGYLRLSKRSSGEVLGEISLKEAMQNFVVVKDEQKDFLRVCCSSLLSQPSIDIIESPSLEITLEDRSVPLKMSIPLDGSQALLNLNVTTPHLGALPIAVDLIFEPTLAVLEDENEGVCLVAFDHTGRLWSHRFSQENIPVMYAYDNGYAGYSLRADLPFSMSLDRKLKETTLVNYVKAQMRDALENNKALSPPLELLKQTCHEQQLDFVDTCLDFLIFWDQQNSWLLPVDAFMTEKMTTAFAHLNFDSLSLKDKKALIWISHLFKRLDRDLKSGKDVLALLEDHEWPMLKDIDTLEHSDMNRSTSILTQLTQQMYGLADLIEPPEKVFSFKTDTPNDKAHLFSAYLRTFGIHLQTIMPTFSADEMQSLLQEATKTITTSPLTLETSLVHAYQKLYPEKKIEDNLPSITLKAYKNGIFQTISLSYNRFASGLKWPMLNGEYLVRFQPKFSKIPYHVRLRQARQINYANSSQPFSFESDVIITDQRTGHSIEKTISMNDVHETWDGYRFYLSNISPPTETAVKQVQLIVNHDPAKYWLTYPGAIIMTVGIVLLFWMRPYRKRI